MLKLNYHLDSQSGWIEIHVNQLDSFDSTGELYKLFSPFVRMGPDKLYLEEYTDGDILIRRLKDLKMPHELAPIWDGESSLIRDLPYLKTETQN